MKKTLRLIITLECNLSCSYCCNNLPEVKKQFKVKEIKEINFKQYDAVCITGGEPFLYPWLVRRTIYNIMPYRTDMEFYLYTNGLLFDATASMKNTIALFNGVNVGIHFPGQFEKIHHYLKFSSHTRFCVNEDNVSWLKDKLPVSRIKTYKLNQCNVPGEDWVQLKIN